MRFSHLCLTALVVSLFFCAPAAAEDPNEPQVRIDVPDRWRSATVSVYIFNMPWDGEEFTQDSITVKIAVWGADEDNPVYIRLDGEQAAEITTQGMFTYTWTLRGSHHLLIRDDYVIFDQAGFNIEAPPPPDPVIKVKEFEAKLAEQFTSMIMYMVAATAGGVPSGIWLKKRTKITSQWAHVVPAAGLVLGANYLPDLYMLIPWAIAASLTYQLAKPYAVSRGLLSLEENGIHVDHLYLDDDGYKVEGISPKYWRDGFVKRKRLEIKDEYPVLLSGYRWNLTSLCVKKITETEDRILIECDRALAVTLMIKNVVQELSQENAQLKARNTILESIGSALSAKQIQQEVSARLIGIYRGELGQVNPKAFTEAYKQLERKIKKEAQSLE